MISKRRIWWFLNHNLINKQAKNNKRILRAVVFHLVDPVGKDGWNIIRDTKLCQFQLSVNKSQMLHNLSNESTSLALRLLILALCLSQTSFSLPSLFTYKQTVWIPLLFVVAITIFKKQFTRNWALPIHYGRKIIMLWNSWKQAPRVNNWQRPRHFLRDFPPRKTRVVQMHRTIFRQENMTYSSSRRADTWFPSLPPKSAQTDVRWRHNQNFSDG